jgi:hypothetical protein
LGAAVDAANNLWEDRRNRNAPEAPQFYAVFDEARSCLAADDAGFFVNVRMGMGENARTPGPATSQAHRAMNDAAELAAWRAAPRMTSAKSAREQLASARARVAHRQRAAKARIAGHPPRFSAGPNIGVGFAVLALLVVVGVMIGKSIKAQNSGSVTVPGGDGAGDNPMRMPMRIVTPTGEWSVELAGGTEMLLVNEDEPIMDAVVIDANGAVSSFDAAPAAFLPRLLAGADGLGRVGVVWDRSSLDPDRAAALHGVADILEDGGATLVGYDDRKEDIDAAARMRQIIGVSGIDDPGVRSSLTDWMTTSGMTSLIYVERDAPWVILDVTGAGLIGAMGQPTVVPVQKPRAVPETAAPTVGPEGQVGPQI